MRDEEIYREVRWDLMRYATSLVGPDDAGDVVSTVVTRVLQRPGGLSGLDDAKPYLIRAITNEARARHRTRSRRREIDTTLRLDPSPEPGFNGDVVDLLMSLPPRQRAALYLVGYEGYEPTEAAGLLGCRPATVRRYLFLARRKLSEVLDG